MNKKTLIVAITVIVIIVVGFYFLSKPKVAETPLDATKTINTLSSSAVSPSSDAKNVNVQSYNVSVENFVFNPAEVKIKKGDTVTWMNRDSAPHTIFGGGLKSDTLKKGQVFSFTFGDAGIYDYICGIHPYMKGKVIVE